MRRSSNDPRPVTDIKDVPQSCVSMVTDFSEMTDDGHRSRFRQRLHNLPLFGRKAEVESLKASFEAVAATGKSELIFCHGASGVGKSKLIQQSLRDPVFARGGFFVTGKFDQLLSNAPYSAIVAAFSDLCDLIYHSPQRDEICDTIRDAFAEPEINVLVRLVPSLKYLMGDFAEGISGQVENPQAELTRFKILCRRFLGVLATAKPLVLVLDDLQWSDQSSVDLIQSIIKREDNHLLVICAYRDEDVQNEGTVAKSPLDMLLKSCDKGSFPVKVKRISLSGLDIDSLNHMVAVITNRDLDDTLPLSEVILQKTIGNAYFCVRFIEMLEAENFLLSPNMGELRGHPTETTQWDWDLTAVQNETNATDNVASLVVDKLQRVEPSVQLVLVYAAFLGYRFPFDLLKQLIVNEGTSQENRGVVLNGLWEALEATMEGTSLDAQLTLVTAQALDLAMTEGLVEQTGTLMFKFSHDKVQDCLLKMISLEDQLSLLHLRIGRVVFGVMRSEETSEDWLVFLAVDNFNKAAEHLLHDSEGRSMLVELNLEAGELATSKCAYVPANDYLRCAVSGLSQEGWLENYALCLKVHEVAADTEYCTGNPSRSQELIRTIMENATCKEDTLRAYQTKVSALFFEGKLIKALNVGLSALRQFDIKLPQPRKTTVAHVIIEFAKTKHALGKHSFGDLQQLPQVQEANIIAAGRILSAAGLTAYSLRDKGKYTFALITLRAVRVTLQFGLCSLSPQAFAGYGALMSIFGNPKLGCQYADLSHTLTAQLNARDTESKTIVTTHTIVFHWSKAMEDTHDELRRGYRIGMEHADINYAFTSFKASIQSAFLLGIFPLSKVEEDAQSFVELAEESNVSHLRTNILAVHQAAINLMGRNESDPARLRGDVADEVDLIAINARTKNVNSKTVVNFCCLILAYHFEDMSLLKKYIVAVEENHRCVAGHYLQRFMLFYIGMAHSLLYKWSGKRKHRSGVKKMAAIFRSWSNKGYANNKPLAELLNMERVASTTKPSKREIWYEATQKAINASAEVGLGVSWAIAYERAALMMLQLEDRQKAIGYADIALALYDKLEMWGKAGFLEKKWRAMMTAEEQAA